MALVAKSKGALAYLALAGEVIRREETRKQALTLQPAGAVRDTPIAAAE
jgi:hypothetical protein